MNYLSSMRSPPSLSALLLSLILAVTAQGMAFARGQAPAEGQMILCTGQGMVMVFTDADGRPTSPPQLCADGAQALLALNLVMPLVAFAPSGVSELVSWSGHQQGTPAHLPRRSARDPPRV